VFGISLFSFQILKSVHNPGFETRAVSFLIPLLLWQCGVPDQLSQSYSPSLLVQDMLAVMSNVVYITSRFQVSIHEMKNIIA
jgi:hypothetical protein